MHDTCEYNGVYFFGILISETDDMYILLRVSRVHTFRLDYFIRLKLNHTTHLNLQGAGYIAFADLVHV